MLISVVDLTLDDDHNKIFSSSPSTMGESLHTCQNEIISRSGNALANANDMFVDRLPKLMRSFPMTDSCVPLSFIKREVNDPALTALSLGHSCESDHNINIYIPPFPMKISTLSPTGYYPHHTTYGSYSPAITPIFPGSYIDSDNAPPIAHLVQSVSNMPDILNLLPMKHIYRTTYDTFRVQVGKGVKGKPHGKFSRNIRNETDALWLCEIALLFIDCPPNLSEMLCNGNYKCLLQRNMVHSPEHYLATIATKIEEMRSRGYVRHEEWERATGALQFILNTASVSTAAAAITSSQLLPQHTSSLQGVAFSKSSSFIKSRRKRIRHNICDQPVGDQSKHFSSLTSTSRPLSPQSQISFPPSPLSQPLAEHSHSDLEYL